MEAVEATVACLFCGRSGTASGMCGSCGASLPAAGDDPAMDQAQCPRCQVALDALEKTTARGCMKCRGMFVTPKAWTKLIAAPEEAVAVAMDDRKPDEAPSLLPFVSCPVCKFEMERVRFGGATEIVVDICEHRHGIWLDAGELTSIAAFLKLRAEVGEEKIREEAAKTDEAAVALVREATAQATGVTMPPHESAEVSAPAPAQAAAAAKKLNAPVTPINKLGLAVFLGLSILGIYLMRACAEPDAKPVNGAPRGASSADYSETSASE